LTLGEVNQSAGKKTKLEVFYALKEQQLIAQDNALCNRDKKIAPRSGVEKREKAS